MTEIYIKIETLIRWLISTWSYKKVRYKFSQEIIYGNEAWKKNANLEFNVQSTLIDPLGRNICDYKIINYK